MSFGETPVPVQGRVRATGIVAAGMMGMNVLTYAFSLLCARLLGPSDFGAVSALLGVMIVANVGTLALQATAARRLATTRPSHLDAVTHDVIRSGWRIAIAVAVLLLAAAPLLDRFLHLDDWVAACAPALVMGPVTLMGAYAGVLQGERRWGPLALVYASLGGGRVVAGVGALLIDASLRSAMIGVVVGGLAPALVGAVSCRVEHVRVLRDDHEPVLRELWTNGQTLLAFFAFTNLDVLLARYLFDERQAGIYAAGAILAKACLFLPTFVLVVAFPTMAAERGGRPWLKPLLGVGALGLTAVIGAALLPDLAVAFAGGSAYGDLAGVAWLFAVEGTVLAALQILVYDTIAGQTHSGFVLWLGALVVLVVALVAIDSVSYLVALVALVACGVGLVTSLMPGATHPD